MRKWTALVLVATMLLAVVGCTTADTTDEADGDSAAEEPIGTVTVGSKIDTEGEVLGQMIMQLLEANGFDVVDQIKTGTTDVVRAALESGEIDIYPEYTGTAAWMFTDAEITPEVSKDAQALYDAAKEYDAGNDIVWLGRAPANNTWAIAIPQELADANAIETIGDWAEWISEGGEAKLVGSQEFVDREDALKAAEEGYGFELASDQLIILAGGNTAQSESAAANGTDGANASMAYGTDGNLSALGLVVLRDPMSVWAVYEPAPTVRADVLEMYPEIAEILDPVFADLTLEILQDLNGRVSVNGEAAADVVHEFLTDNGYVG
ncbi:MAG: ABC transporter substrate-binding protein [Actinomycetota bacterium]|jgi:osmoprotectant transport system substrate-binding protein|nr:ABC transporter substrate-binding protein [Actinomycetota bacterium]